MERWVVAAKRADFQAIAEKFRIDPVIARLIRNRDVVGDEQIREYLYGGLEELHDPMLMKDMGKAAEILEKKIREGKWIRIIGDYDIDGIMSTYILLTGLRRLGAKVDIRIPDRIVDGYGLNENLVRQAKEDGADTILTCDNGIAALDQIRLAKELGMTVVVTDHHEIPYEDLENGARAYHVPEADAVVNPKQKDCGYPFRGLCGGAVAWKLIQVMLKRFGHSEEESFDWLEFAAIATVGDVMDLQGENRILVKEGLKRLHRTGNLGLQELIRVQGLEPDQVSAYHIGFVIGPCLNASGRLDTAERSLALLLAEKREEAARLAGDLKALNESRKEMTRQGEE
ncbi:MAG TPA: DHH family phosphoesterase, partial [Candidatus Fusicatenibacter merdavium]|nr:DHH family phosphoesterase [Candidatus Fusicatenibacter merdavium]